MKHNQFITKIKDYNEEERTITMIGSTETADRVGDIIKMDGVDLTNYLKNPVILFNHDYDKIIGKAIDVDIVDSKLIFKIQFADTALGKEVYYLLKNGYMNASSVGFIGKEYEGNEAGGLTFTKIELLELSIVSVPCNPNALVQLRKDFNKKMVSEQMYKTLGGNMANKKVKALSEEEIDKIRQAIDLLNSVFQEDNAEEDEAEEEEATEEESVVENAADTLNEDETATEEDEEEKPEEEEEEKKKSFSNEELIKEILKNLGGK